MPEELNYMNPREWWYQIRNEQKSDRIMEYLYRKWMEDEPHVDYWEFGYKKGVNEHIHEAPKQKYKLYLKIQKYKSTN